MCMRYLLGILRSSDGQTSSTNFLNWFVDCSDVAPTLKVELILSLQVWSLTLSLAVAGAGAGAAAAFAFKSAALSYTLVVIAYPSSAYIFKEQS